MISFMKMIPFIDFIVKLKNNRTGERTNASAILPIPLAPELAGQVPSISMYSRLGSNGGYILKNQTKYQETITFVDKDFLSMFSFPIIVGNAQALDEPHSTVISSQVATKIFGSTDPIGKTLEIVLNDSSQAFIVGAVINTHRERSSLDLNVMVSFDVFGVIAPEAMTSYKYASIESYLVLENPDVENGISPVLTSALAREDEEDTSHEIGIQPMSDIHLDQSIISNALNTTTPEKLYIISALGFSCLTGGGHQFHHFVDESFFEKAERNGSQKDIRSCQISD